MSPEEWEHLFTKIKTKEKPSVYLSRDKMKRVLGFTVREHSEWVTLPEGDTPAWWEEEQGGWYQGKRNEHTIRLDFYDEQKRTIFLLKYGNGKP